MLTLEPTEEKGTNIGECLRFFNNASKKRTIAFLLSDFISAPYEEPLKLTARRHDLVGVQVYDKADRELPDAGLIQVQDSETRELQWLDTSDKKVRLQYAEAFVQHQKYGINAFRKTGAELISVRTDEDYVKILQGFFINR